MPQAQSAVAALIMSSGIQMHWPMVSKMACTMFLSPSVALTADKQVILARTFMAVFSIDGSDPHLMPDLAAAIDVGEAAR